MVHAPRDDAAPRRTGVFRRRGPFPTASAADATRRTRYVDQGRVVIAPPETTVAAAQEFTDADPSRTALLLYPKPSPEDIAELANAWSLHPLLVEDLLHAGQRPKLERYDDALFIVARSAWYIDAEEDVDFAEFHIVVRGGAIAVLCQDGRWIDGVDAGEASGAADRGDRTFLDDQKLLHEGPEAIVYRLLDAIVDGYAPVLRGLSIDREQIERQVFSGDATVTERIYRLSQEILDLQQATAARNVSCGTAGHDVQSRGEPPVRCRRSRGQYRQCRIVVGFVGDLAHQFGVGDVAVRVDHHDGAGQ